MKILNYGSLNIDDTYRVDHIVAPGETITSASLERFPGGKGLNQSVALARAGACVFHGGAVGTDGQMLLDTCVKNGIDTSLIRTIPTPTGHAIIQVDNTGQNCIVLFPGANRAQEDAWLEEAISRFAPGDLLLLQNEINGIDTLIRLAKAQGMRVALNPSPFDANIRADMLDGVDVFLLNEIEGAQLTGQDTPDDILRVMAEKWPDALVVLTLGKAGACCLYRGEVTRQNAFPVRAVDTTGAGDTFTGFFLAGWMEGAPVSEALRFACAASAIAVTRKGASTSIPTLAEVRAWLDKN